MQEPLTYSSARAIVQSTLREALQEHEQQIIKRFGKGSICASAHILAYIVLPPALCCALLGAAIVLAPDFAVDAITTISILFLSTLINLYIIFRVNSSEKLEVYGEVSSMLEDYSKFLNAQSNLDSESGGVLGSSESTSTGILSGHPHISIVTTYRNREWRRIPTLLLAEGDIVALMCGDITPGAVWELNPIDASVPAFFPTSNSKAVHNSTSNAPAARISKKSDSGKRGSQLSGSSPSQKSSFLDPQKWTRGNMLSSGTKVVSRNDKSSSGSNSGTHAAYRTVASDSIHLLILSGDIRCFEMAETPVKAYARQLLGNVAKDQTSVDEGEANVQTLHTEDAPLFPLKLFQNPPVQQPGDEKYSKSSILRSLFHVILRKAIEFMLIEIVLLIVVIVIKVQVTDVTRAKWAETVLLPLASVVICFVPVSLPLLLLAAEAFVTADVLTTTELILLGEDDEEEEETKEIEERQQTTADEDETAQTNTLDKKSNKGYDPLDPKRRVSVGDKKNKVNCTVDSNVRMTDEMDSEDSDGFDDDDIDERIEAEADEDMKVISTWRWMQYFIHVLRTRLGFHSKDFDRAGRGPTSYLLQQQLHRDSGKLLADLSNVPFLPVPLAKARLVEVLGAVTMICFIDDDVICEPFSVCEEVFLLKPGSAPTSTSSQNVRNADTTLPPKGVVLDLHANPEATGSRFEDPLWWKYLNSLKPIGLNALLTHTPTPPSQILSTGSQDVVLTKSTLNGIPPLLTRQLRKASTTGHIAAAFLDPKESSSSATHRKRNSSQMQAGLVGHIRKVLPLAVLRELAGEIGFDDSDVSTFMRLLETNVIAPRLGDAKLLEDTHAWGQEDTRKRGTLFSHARGAIVQDSRGGGLQMMTQGEPALILNYCREYWDGSNITPFSVPDRKEVLSVYERWEMEDFDVIAFAYSPVPSSLKPLIVAAHQEDLKRRHVGDIHHPAVNSENNNASLLEESETSSLFFVDPRTVEQLQNMQVKVHKNRSISMQGTENVALIDNMPKNTSPTEEGRSKRVNSGSPVQSIQGSSPLARTSPTNPEYPFSGPSRVDTQDVALGPLECRSRSHTQDSQGRLAKSSSDSALVTQNISVRSSALGDANDAMSSVDSNTDTGSATALPITQSQSFSHLPTERENMKSQGHFVPKAGSVSAKIFRSVTSSDFEELIPGQFDDFSLHFEDEVYEKFANSSVSPRSIKSASTYGNETINSDPSTMNQTSGGHLQTSAFSAKTQHLHKDSIQVPEFADQSDYIGRHEHRIHPDSHELATSSISNPTVGNRIDHGDADAEEYLEGEVYQEGDGDEYRDGAEYGEGEEDQDGEGDMEYLEGELEEYAVLDEGENYADADVYGYAAGSEKVANYAEMLNKESSNTALDMRTIVETEDLNASLDIEQTNLAAGLSASSSYGVGLDMIVGSESPSKRISNKMSNSRRSSRSERDRARLSDSNLERHTATEDRTDKSKYEMYDESASGFDLGSDSAHDALSVMDAVGGWSLPAVPVQNQNQWDTSDKVTAYPPDAPVESARSMSPQADSSSLIVADQGVTTSSRMLDFATPSAAMPHSSSKQNKLKQSKTPKRMDDGVRRRQSKNLRRMTHNISTSLWPLVRHQVFLGMAASSVPVKNEVPTLMEDLTAAGVRFVYFSPRNMRRSKPVAEKIGIQFDWNCAISLRELSTSGEHDPHRYISNYADWDVHARMPHGVPEIKRHLREVDNVPLLVSLYTDSTPATTQQMVEVFRSYGEVVLTVGSAYRASNSGIFRAANIAVSVNMLPGDQNPLHIHADSVLRDYPELSGRSLTRADLALVFRLVSLGAVHLLQTPPTLCATLPSVAANTSTSANDEAARLIDSNNPEVDRHGVGQLLPGLDMCGAGPQLRMEALLEAVRRGRVLLNNALQAMAMICVALLSLGVWPLTAMVLPVSVPPSLSPFNAQLYLFIYIPLLLLAIINSPAPKNVLKITPRKNIFNLSNKDEMRFTKYLLCRVGFTALCMYAMGWVCSASVAYPGGIWHDHMLQRIDLIVDDGGNAAFRKFSLVQDMMSLQLLLSLIIHAVTLLERGQTWTRPSIPSIWKHPTLYICISLALAVHIGVMVLRAFSRDGFADYANLDYIVWLVLAVGTVCTFFVAFAVNAHDDKRHRRYIEFLRLDFDTKLGMHSPR